MNMILNRMGVKPVMGAASYGCSTVPKRQNHPVIRRNRTAEISAETQSAMLYRLFTRRSDERACLGLIGLQRPLPERRGIEFVRRGLVGHVYEVDREAAWNPVIRQVIPEEPAVRAGVGFF